VLTIDIGEMVPVYVMGRVRVPGIYRLRKDDAGIMQAIAVAGGTSDRASISKVTVTHLSGASETVDLTSSVVGGKPAPKTVLQPGDLVIVPESTYGVAVLGFVKKAGFYPLDEGHKVHLMDALGMAEGLEDRAKTGAVAVVRNENGKQLKMEYNLRKFLKEGDTTQNPEIKPGDVVFVPETGKIDWNKLLPFLSTAGVLYYYL
jgi:polysaccharide export outer membrane protein